MNILINFLPVVVLGAAIAAVFMLLKAKWPDSRPYKLAVGLALTGAFLLFWINGAVGIIGSEDNLANLMYVGVFVVGIIGAVIARFQPEGMARALFATALAQALVAAITLIAGLGLPASPPMEIIGINGFFVMLFVGSAALFRHAAQQQRPAGAEPVTGLR